jgi:hypothetical protein
LCWLGSKQSRIAHCTLVLGVRRISLHLGYKQKGGVPEPLRGSPCTGRPP